MTKSLVKKLCAFVGLLLFVPAMLACVLGNAMDADLQYSGKCTIDLIIDKENVAEYAQDMSSFEEFFDGYLDAINDASGVSVEKDIAVAKKYSEDENYYYVTIKTRRIDKISGVGSMDFRVASTYAMFANEMDMLEDYDNGLIWSDKTFTRVGYSTEGSYSYTISLSLSDGNRMYVSPKDVKSGEVCDFNEFSAWLASSSDKIVVFQLFDFMFADSIRLTVGGKLKYVSTGCCEVVDEHTIEITPVELTHTKTTVSNEGEVVTTTETYQSMIGYFVYDPNMAPIAIVGIVFGCLLGVALIAFIAVVVYQTHRENVYIKERYEAIGQLYEERKTVVEEGQTEEEGNEKR